jgi:hypothetical protein
MMPAPTMNSTHPEASQGGLGREESKSCSNNKSFIFIDKLNLHDSLKFIKINIIIPLRPPDGSCLSHSHHPNWSPSIRYKLPVIARAPTQQ